MGEDKHFDAEKVSIDVVFGVDVLCFGVGAKNVTKKLLVSEKVVSRRDRSSECQQSLGVSTSEFLVTSLQNGRGCATNRKPAWASWRYLKYGTDTLGKRVIRMLHTTLLSMWTSRSVCYLLSSVACII